MHYFKYVSRGLWIAGIGLLTTGAFAQTTPAAKPYAIVKTAQLMGTGGIDYVFADSEGRREWRLDTGMFRWFL